MVKRKNLIWAAVFAAVIAACLIFIFLTGGRSGENSAEIYENGKLIKTISDLSPDKEYSFEIKTENGTNTITVGDGSIWVSVADVSPTIFITSLCGAQMTVCPAWDIFPA